MPKTTTIPELKSSLEVILHQVKCGETFLVIEHSEPIARITPVEQELLEPSRLRLPGLPRPAWVPLPLEVPAAAV
ncbi:MAG TPA: hypothetical protein DD490_26815 [Acidobacteria bacterium]|nr:hypothetical protein [Acidobacteriota bacterium]